MTRNWRTHVCVNRVYITKGLLTTHAHTMLLGDVLDSEDVHTECKEFCFKNNVYDIFSKRDIHDFVMTNRWLPNLNEAIIENLHKYFSFYVPKYMSAFHNSRKALCKLYIGVNDYGEITGIPFRKSANIFRVFQNIH